MENKTVSVKKIPTRSKISDKELAEKIRRERAERPDEFSPRVSSPSVSSKAHFISSASEVIFKWL